MPIETVRVPDIGALWQAGVECSRCLTQYVFTGEDLTRWTEPYAPGGSPPEIAFVRCPTCRFRVDFAQEALPGWLWVRLTQDRPWAGWD